MSTWLYKWQVLVSVMFGTFMVMIDATVVNVALPKLQTVFGVEKVSEVQWVISAYTLALGIVTPVSGFLADRYGIKKMYLLSLAAFTLSSALCALAPNLPLMVFFRVVQGVGGGSVIPLGTAMLFGAFPKEERGMAYGFFGMGMVVAPALGPLLSGFFVEYLDWRLIFLVNVPIGLTGIFIGFKYLKETNLEAAQKLDGLGIISSTFAFGLLLYAFSSAQQDSWTSNVVIFCLIFGGLSLLAFIVIELRQSQPLVNLRHFQNYTFLIGTVLAWVSAIALFGAEFLLPLYLQILRGVSAIETGFLLLPLAVASGVIVPVAGKISDKIGAKLPMIMGFLLLIFNTWQFSQLTLDTDYSYLIFLVALRGVSFGLIVQIPQQVALRDVEVEALPRATSLVSSSRLVFQSMGVALLATLVSLMAGNRPNFLPGVQPDVQALQLYRLNFLQGLQNAYTATLWVGVVALLLSFFLPGWPSKNWQPLSKSENVLPEEELAEVKLER